MIIVKWNYWYNFGFFYLLFKNRNKLSEGHKMNYNSYGNKYVPVLEELNELAHWVFDSEQYEVGVTSSSDNVIDLDFRQPSEQFFCFDESEHLEVDGLSHQIGNISFEEFTSDFERLKEPYLWDDDSKLSEVGGFGDIFDYLSGDIFDSAFEKLNWLFSGVDNCKLYGDGDSEGYNTSWNGTFSEDRDVPLDIFPKPAKIGSEFAQYFGIDDEFTGKNFSLSDGKLFIDDDEINAMLRRLTSVDVESESEEKDLYLRCRKDAIKMMSDATHHLNEAKNSLLRGDHISAKRLSQKAQKERKAAKKLHNEAAREILKIKNKNNGIMKLDLHCLHVTEAVQAVKERLHLIETQKGLKNSDEQAFGKLKKKRLEVITGRGKHSIGAPKLPGAVRSFLMKEGYKCDVSRPGVIMVRPKFRAN